MSRHQHVRNLDYQAVLEEDDYYSEGEDELSPEDKEAMRQGTAEVKAALGVEAHKVSIEQIEEALWYYYYDVDKTVAYLITKYIDPPKKTPKAPQKPNGKSLSFLYLSTPRVPSGRSTTGTHVGPLGFRLYSPQPLPY